MTSHSEQSERHDVVYIEAAYHVAELLERLASHGEPMVSDEPIVDSDTEMADPEDLGEITIGTKFRVTTTDKDGNSTAYFYDEVGEVSQTEVISDSIGRPVIPSASMTFEVGTGDKAAVSSVDGQIYVTNQGVFAITEITHDPKESFSDDQLRCMRMMASMGLLSVWVDDLAKFERGEPRPAQAVNELDLSQVLGLTATLEKYDGLASIPPPKIV